MYDLETSKIGSRSTMIKKNLDISGRIVRLLIATLLLIFAIWQKSWIALAFSFFVFFEALMSWCVIYQLIGKNNCPLNNDSSHKNISIE